MSWDLLVAGCTFLIFAVDGVTGCILPLVFHVLRFLFDFALQIFLFFFVYSVKIAVVQPVAGSTCCRRRCRPPRRWRRCWRASAPGRHLTTRWPWCPPTTRRRWACGWPSGARSWPKTGCAWNRVAPAAHWTWRSVATNPCAPRTGWSFDLRWKLGVFACFYRKNLVFVSTLFDGGFVATDFFQI